MRYPNKYPNLCSQPEIDLSVFLTFATVKGISVIFYYGTNIFQVVSRGLFLCYLTGVFCPEDRGKSHHDTTQVNITALEVTIFSETG
jgi:hypothetical protein